ncbi:secretory calcium-binding phosphoprotein 7 [Paralichthys olivaceus]|uniref:secretory calcium-binding phosphoprotein 7 n=1 Tax=Paralichthys olivaceus TaxID=8255 RepID=UPI00374FE123
MKFLLLAACILGMALCGPPQMFMEFDIRHAPAQAAQAIPAGAPLGTLDVLLPVDAQRRLVGGPVRGFIKQEMPEPNGRGTKDVYYPFGFDLTDLAAAAPVAPINPILSAAPAAAAAPAAKAAPVQPIAAAHAPAAKPSGDDDDDDDDD